MASHSIGTGCHTKQHQTNIINTAKIIINLHLQYCLDRGETGIVWQTHPSAHHLRYSYPSWQYIKVTNVRNIQIHVGSTQSFSFQDFVPTWCPCLVPGRSFSMVNMPNGTHLPKLPVTRGDTCLKRFKLCPWYFTMGNSIKWLKHHPPYFTMRHVT